MGYIETEQAVRLIETTTNAIKTAQPDPEPTNYWWLLIIGVVPVIVGAMLKFKKKP
jgi:hypothetical protein